MDCLGSGVVFLVRTSGLTGFWSVFDVFGRFWSVSGPRETVWLDSRFVNATIPRRIYPHGPEASAQ